MFGHLDMTFIGVRWMGGDIGHSRPLEFANYPDMGWLNQSMTSPILIRFLPTHRMWPSSLWQNFTCFWLVGSYCFFSVRSQFVYVLMKQLKSYGNFWCNSAWIAAPK
jgi:hypothetical protein